MKKLFSYLKHYLKECILAPSFKFLEVCFEMFVPLVVADVIDTAIPSGNKGMIIGRCLILAALAIIGFSCTLVAQRYSAKVATTTAGELRRDLFRKIQSMSYTDLDTIGTNTLLNRMTVDINQIQSGVNLTLRLILRSPIVVIGATIMAFTIDVKAGLIFCLMVPILAVIIFTITLKSKPMNKQVQGKLDGLTKLTRENLNGVRVIRAFTREQSEIEEFTAQQDDLRDSRIRVGNITFMLNPLTTITVNTFISILIYCGAKNVDLGLLTQGEVIALYNYMSQILVELVKLANLIININKSVISANRVEEILDMPLSETVDATAPGTDSEAKIVFRDVAFRYTGSSVNVLDNINLSIMPGENIGIIGGIGSSKTTLINMIPRFYDATSGAVYVDGKDVRSYDPEKLRAKISMVAQKSSIFSGTIRSNLLVSNPEASEQEMLEALEGACCSELLNKEGGLDAVIEQGGRNLSGGQKQRLSIARGLVRKPEILILDDVFSALDYATDARMRKTLASLSWHPTIITVSQRISSIRHCSRIIVMDEGEISAVGTHDELLKTSETYREIASTQLEKEAE